MTANQHPWRVASVRDRLVDEFPGEWGDEQTGLSGNAKVLRSTNIDDDGHVNYETSVERVISASKLAAKHLIHGDIMLEASGGGPGKPVGRVAAFEPTDERDYIVSNFFRTLRPDTNYVLPRFLLWRLLQLYTNPSIWSFQQQTTGIINLKSAEYLAQTLEWPPLPEQHAIATILDTIDAAIQQTDALIGKLRQMKAGLLHDLLTRGLDDNGELRDPVAHPEQFKTSALGLIPRAWKATTIGDVLAEYGTAMRSGPFGSALLKEELTSSGIPLLGIDNVYPEQFVSEYTRFISKEKYEELKRYTVFPGDVLVTIMGTVGRSCVAPETLPRAISSKHVWTITLDLNLYLPELLCAQINHSAWVHRFFLSQSQGSTMPAVNSSVLRSTPIPIPPFQEQKKILSVYQAYDERIHAEEATREKLALLKRGLMDDLLTGRVRVVGMLSGDPSK